MITIFKYENDLLIYDNDIWLYFSGFLALYILKCLNRIKFYNDFFMQLIPESFL